MDAPDCRVWLYSGCVRVSVSSYGTGYSSIVFFGRSPQPRPSIHQAPQCVYAVSRRFAHFIATEIFPGGDVPPPELVLESARAAGFELVHAESLRPHYARTLEHWLERFDKSSQQVAAMYDPWFERAWRLYLAGSIAAFRAGTLQLFQISFAGQARQPISWTRAPLYTEVKDSKWMHATS